MLLEPPLECNEVQSGLLKAAVGRSFVWPDPYSKGEREVTWVKVAFCETMIDADEAAAAMELGENAKAPGAGDLTVAGLSEQQMRTQAFRNKLIKFWKKNLKDLEEIKTMMAIERLLS